MTTRFANGTVAEALTARAAEVAMALLGLGGKARSPKQMQGNGGAAVSSGSAPMRAPDKET